LIDLHSVVFQLTQRPPSREDEMMVPVLDAKKASQLPVNEVACILQVPAHADTHKPTLRPASAPPPELGPVQLA